MVIFCLCACFSLVVCAAVCCRELQCVAVCSVLQRVAMCCSVQCVAESCSVLQSRWLSAFRALYEDTRCSVGVCSVLVYER